MSAVEPVAWMDRDGDVWAVSGEGLTTAGSGTELTREQVEDVCGPLVPLVPVDLEPVAYADRDGAVWVPSGSRRGGMVFYATRGADDIESVDRVERESGPLTPLVAVHKGGQ